MKKTRFAACVAAICLGCAALAACGDNNRGDSLVTDPEDLETVVPLPQPPADTQEPPVVEPLPDPAPDPEPDPVPDPAPLRAQYVYVRSDGLNVRAGAGTSFASLGTLEKGILLQLNGTENGWHETYYKNRKAYVSANTKYTSVTLLDRGESDVENVIEEGLRLLGVPYVYGAVRLHDGKGNFLKGFTVKQFDCSSLMQYIFYQGAGKLLDVTTRTQIVQGKEVKKSEIKRGDLLFFTNASRKDKAGLERVGHVALYLGDNYILHTASDYAKIEQISATRWSYYLAAKRVL